MRVDVYYRILVDAKVPWGLLKPSLKRHYQGTLMWAASRREGGAVERERESEGKEREEREVLGLAS